MSKRLDKCVQTFAELEKQRTEVLFRVVTMVFERFELSPDV